LFRDRQPDIARDRLFGVVPLVLLITIAIVILLSLI
jgi:hypothetical protein